MDTDKILQFLQQIIDKLGPMGEQAYRIVATRVFAESLIGVVISLLLIAVVAIAFIKVWKHTRDWEIRIMAGMVGSAAGVVALLIFIDSLINLISLDYATIERILLLAK